MISQKQNLQVQLLKLQNACYQHGIIPVDTESEEGETKLTETEPIECKE